nr:hypothetical protein BaRGS_034976 [Batillaria attramentaria]
MRRWLAVLTLGVLTVLVEVLGQAVDTGLTDTLRNMIVRRHNMIRSRVRASNMLQLVGNYSYNTCHSTVLLSLDY